MSEYIERDVARQELLKCYDLANATKENYRGETLKDYEVADMIDSVLHNIPSAPARDVVRGKWKKRMEEKETSYCKSFTPIWTCSECETDYDPSFCMTINFCPNCGADMREEKGGQT